jgi:outer membrane lipoprotein SlyB
MAIDFSAVLSQLAGGNILGAVGTAVGGAVSGGTKGTLVGGTVTRVGGGLIFVKTASGKEVAIKRRKTRHYRPSGHRGTRFEKLMEMKMLSNMFK